MSQSVCLFFSLSVCLSVFVSVCFSICLSISVCLSFYQFFYWSLCLSVYLSICTCLVYLSACLSVCLSVYLSVHPSAVNTWWYCLSMRWSCSTSSLTSVLMKYFLSIDIIILAPLLPGESMSSGGLVKEFWEEKKSKSHQKVIRGNIDISYLPHMLYIIMYHLVKSSYILWTVLWIKGIYSLWFLKSISHLSPPPPP